jgi:hypothetical protein
MHKAVTRLRKRQLQNQEQTVGKRVSRVKKDAAGAVVRLASTPGGNVNCIQVHKAVAWAVSAKPADTAGGRGVEAWPRMQLELQSGWHQSLGARSRLHVGAQSCR